MITGENTRQEDVPEGAWFLPFLSEAGQTDLRRICGTNMKQEFYYQQMNKAQQNAYRAMLDGFESLSPEFPVLRLDGKELSDIFSGSAWTIRPYFMWRAFTTGLPRIQSMYR